MKVDGVLETCIYAAELEATAAFYAQVLGLEPISRKTGRHAFFRSGDAVFLIFNAEVTREASDVPPHGARGDGHVAFRVPESSLDGWKSHLARHGVPIEAEVEWPRGGRSLYFRDPAGNSVELAPARIWGV